MAILTAGCRRLAEEKPAQRTSGKYLVDAELGGRSMSFYADTVNVRFLCGRLATAMGP